MCPQSGRVCGRLRVLLSDGILSLDLGSELQNIKASLSESETSLPFKAGTEELSFLRLGAGKRLHRSGCGVRGGFPSEKNPAAVLVLLSSACITPREGVPGTTARVLPRKVSLLVLGAAR